MPITFEDLLARKKPATLAVDLILDPALAVELDEARKARDVASARASVRPNDSEVQTELWAAQEKVLALERSVEEDELVVWFTFQAIGRAAFEMLVDAHPITAEERLRLKRLGLKDDMLAQISYNEKTFAPALVAACLVEPAATEEQIAAMWDSDRFNQAELSKLVVAAMKVNGEARTAGLGKDSKTTRASGSKSPTAPNGVSPTRSS